MDGPFHDVFLSHNNTDKPAVEELARRLVREGIQPWLDKWNLIPGEPWQEAIEEALGKCATCAVFIGPSGTGPWQNEEMRTAIDRRVSESNGHFRVIPVLLPGAERIERSRLPAFLTATTWVEFRRSLDDEHALHRLVSGIRGIEPGPGPGQAIYEDACPYRGLQVFDVQHAPFFCGREALTEWLLNELRPSPNPRLDNRFLAIIGPSGSGKSSLARAGLIAALRRGEIAGSAEWPIVICRPGSDPLESLAVALCDSMRIGQNLPVVQKLIKALQHNERALHLAVRLALRNAPQERRLTLLVDQFEEAFTLCHDHRLRHAMIKNLLYAASVAQGQTVVLLGLRADFYAKCAAYAELAAALSDHQVLVGPMTSDELQRAIERPALLVGCEFEPGLVETLLDDVQGQPGGLPLLQHALLDLWERREGRRLTHTAYQAIGGVEGALQRRAEEIYNRFSESEHQVCRRIFLRLIQPGEGIEDTRRRAPLQELLPAEGERAVVETVVQALADARLVTTEFDEPRKGEQFVEVAHEALIRSWPRLREWVEQDRATLRIRRRLTEAAQEWERQGREASYLYGSGRLTEVEQWTKTDAVNLSALESRFIVASIAARRAEQRQRWARRVALLGLSAFVVITLAWLAWTYMNGTGPFRPEEIWQHLGDQEVQASVIVGDTTDPAILYMGTLDGHALKSQDKGKTWTQVLTTGAPISSVTLARDGTLYVSTYNSALFRSHDGGIRWTDSVTVSDASGVYYLAVDPLIPTTLYVSDALHPHIYRSTNSGTSWDKITVASNVKAVAALTTGVIDGAVSVVYVGSSDGQLWRSTDHSRSWQNVSSASPVPYKIVDMVVSAADGNVVYAVAVHGLYRIQADAAGGKVRKLDDLDGLRVAVDPRSWDVIFVSTIGGNVYMVPDHEDGAARQWIASEQSFSHSTQVLWLVASDRMPYFLYAATEKGVFGWIPSRQRTPPLK